MDAILNINTSAVAFGDQVSTNNPKRRYFDWTRNFNGVTVKNPKSDSFVLSPGELRTLFNGTRTLTVDATTAWSVTSMGAGIYRFSWTGGTAPGMRTQRAINFSNANISVTINNNSTITLTSDVANTFLNVSGGDDIYIPEPTDLISSPFSPANGGHWTVLSRTSTTVTLARPTGQTFNAAAESVLVTTNNANGPIIAYSSAGVQTGDSIDILGGFESTTTLKSFQIQDVTCNWFDISSNSPLPNETGVIPGVGAMMFYWNAKRFIRIEADQDIWVNINGVTGDIRINPIAAGDELSIGWFENMGIVRELSVESASAYPCNVNIFSAE